VLPILHADDALVAVAKPAGLTVIPDRTGDVEGCLHHRLERQLGERLWVVHRIDRDTSGVVVFGRTAAAHRTLSMAFEGRDVEKRYLAFTRGLLSPTEGVIDVPLHRARKGRMRPAAPDEPESLPSSSGYRVLRSRPAIGGPVACVEVRPHTGRQHQIRVHLRSNGAPLLVDPLYGRCDRLDAGDLEANAPAVPRLTLHARGLSLPHPGGGGRLDLAAPLPDDLASLDAWLAASP
jgi:tRNA pseudouridine32 synthase/23S rRNA pseudouridine746 synthase